MLSFVIGLTVSNAQTTSDNEVFKVLKGELAKRDSLLAISESIILDKNSIIKDYKVKEEGFKKQIELEKDNCKIQNSSVNGKNYLLTEENKKLRKSRNFWRVVAIGVPTVIAGTVTYLILK